MPRNDIYLAKNYLHSKKLNAVSRKIVDLAFQMGGSPAKYFNAVKCNYVFPDGAPCFDEKRGDHSIDCPLCKGHGAYYDEPVDTAVIVADSVNPLSTDKYGASFEDSITLSVPISINPNIIEISNKGQMFIVKDKFAIYDYASKLWAIFMMDGEPNEPYLAGPLYRIVSVVSQYTQVQKAETDTPKIYYNVEDANLLSEINQDILQLNSYTQSGYPAVQNENIVVTDEPVLKIINTTQNLLDDWE